MSVAIALSLLGLLVGFVLLADLRSPRGTSAPARVSVIIPARDEEASLPRQVFVDLSSGSIHF